MRKPWHWLVQHYADAGDGVGWKEGINYWLNGWKSLKQQIFSTYSMNPGNMELIFTIMKNKCSDSRNRCSAVTVNFNKLCFRSCTEGQTRSCCCERWEKVHVEKWVQLWSAAPWNIYIQSQFTSVIICLGRRYIEMCVMMWDAVVHSVHLFV